MTVPPAFEQEFLPLRAKLLEIAAALDRLDRVGESKGRESRSGSIRVAIETLLGAAGDRAEQIQLVFSRPYEDEWRERLQMPNDQ